jgi:O-acetyl-ADP-ribose deacetylase
VIETWVNGCPLRLRKGDITDLEIDAFVYEARPDLSLGSGYGGAIAVRGGPTIQEELKKIGRLDVGQAVVTSAGNMKARHIIHAVGPRFQEEDEEGKLREATLSVLRLCDEKGIRRVALPAIGTGFYGMPVDRCAAVMVPAVGAYLRGKTELSEVVFCVRDTRDIPPFEARLKKLQEEEVHESASPIR